MLLELLQLWLVLFRGNCTADTVAMKLQVALWEAMVIVGGRFVWRLAITTDQQLVLSQTHGRCKSLSVPTCYM